MAFVENQQSGSQPVSDAIFRAYDIRGIVDSELNRDSVYQVARAIGTEALESGIEEMLVAYDGRLSSPSLSDALIEGLLSTGCNVRSLGCVPTPLLYFATHHSEIDSGVMLTASHNPADYNGLKIVLHRSCLADNQILALRDRIRQQRLASGAGRLKELDIVDAYIDTVRNNVSLERPLRIVVDCGNAVPALIAPRLLETIGCEVIPLYCEVDGNFPNHHPDPTVPENLSALAAEVKAQQADLGIAFDGDGDRLGIVDEQGQFINADAMLQLLVADIAPRHPGKAIVFDVKCSKRLARQIEQLGGKPVMHRSGHSFMKQAMQETGAPLGGEFAAHVFLKDRWFGYDDGIYTAARVLELLSRSRAPVSKQFAPFQSGHGTPEIKVPVPDDRKFELMERIVAAANFPGARLITIDGLRVEYEDGWGLIRASNTSPALLLRFEADTLARLVAIQAEFKTLLSRTDKSLSLEF